MKPTNNRSLWPEAIRHLWPGEVVYWVDTRNPDRDLYAARQSLRTKTNPIPQLIPTSVTLNKTEYHFLAPHEMLPPAKQRGNARNVNFVVIERDGSARWAGENEKTVAPWFKKKEAA